MILYYIILYYIIVYYFMLCYITLYHAPAQAARRNRDAIPALNMGGVR